MKAKENCDKIVLIFSIEGAQQNAKYTFGAKFIEEPRYRFDQKKCSEDNQEIIFNIEKLCDYHFEMIQRIEITIEKEILVNGKIKNFKKNGNIRLSSIIGANKSIYKRKLGDNNNTQTSELFVIKAEKSQSKSSKDCKSFIELTLVVKPLQKMDFGELKNKFYYLLTANKKKIFKSSAVTNDGKFKSHKFPTFILEPNFSIYFINSENKIIGDIETNLEEFSKKENWNKPKAQLLLQKKNMVYIYSYSNLEKEYSVFDYFKAGVRLGITFGIDFTEPNGKPSDLYSPHYICGDKANTYEKLLISVGDTLSYYNYNQQFKVFGFGASNIPGFSAQTSDCFNVSFTDKATISSISTVLEKYRECVNKITFSSPAKLAPIIKKALDFEEYDPQIYNVLVFIVNSLPEDIQETTDEIIKGSYLPLSIIIIGVGNKDYTELKKLSGSNLPKYSKEGHIKKRDIVNFVTLSECNVNDQKMSGILLSQIPKQMNEYYSLNKTSPENLKDQKYAFFDESISIYKSLRNSEIKMSKAFYNKINQERESREQRGVIHDEIQDKYYETPKGNEILESTNPFLIDRIGKGINPNQPGFFINEEENFKENPYINRASTEEDKDNFSFWNSDKSNITIETKSGEKFVNTPLGDDEYKTIIEYKKSKIVFDDEPKEETKFSKDSKMSNNSNGSYKNSCDEIPNRAYGGYPKDYKGNNEFNSLNNNNNDESGQETTIITRRFVNVKNVEKIPTPGNPINYNIVLKEDDKNKNVRNDYINNYNENPYCAEKKYVNTPGNTSGPKNKNINYNNKYNI